MTVLPAGRKANEVVFVGHATTWADGVRRSLYMPGDRLVAGLVGHPCLDRVLVVDPYRSAVVHAVRMLRRPGPVPLPAGHAAAHLAQPRRLRRHDPRRQRSLVRAARRFDGHVRRSASRLGLTSPLIISTNPFHAAYSDTWGAELLYYAWDDWAEWPPLRRWRDAYLRAYDAIDRRGLRVVAVTAELAGRVTGRSPTLVLPNGVNRELFDRPPAPPDWFVGLTPPRIVYSGTLDERVDVGLLRAVAARLPHVSLVVVGGAGATGAAPSLPDLPNVFLAGARPHSEVASLLRVADVGLIAHRRTDLTLSMSPLKLYEYLAGGCPVATTVLPSEHGLAGDVAAHVRVAQSTEFVDAVVDALRSGRLPEAVRSAVTREHSWDRRMESLLRFGFGRGTVDAVGGA